MFTKIICFDIRLAESTYSNDLRFGAARLVKPYHPSLIQLFNKTIIDPALYLRKGYNRDNLCLPMTLLLCLHAKFGPALRGRGVTSIKMMEKEMESIPYHSLLDESQIGIGINQFQSFEKLLSPIPSSLANLFPPLHFFSGISLNGYTIKRRENDFRIYPTSLSKKSRDGSWFQCDMLFDSPCIRPTDDKQFTSTKTKNQQVLHTLAIRSLSNLINKHRKGSNVSKFSFICRSCMKSYTSNSARHAHFQTCTEKARGVVGRRKVENRLIHRPQRYNTFKKKMEPNGLFFKRKWAGTMLRSPLLSCLDLESYHKEIVDSKRDASSFENVPRQAVSVQSPMSFCFLHHNLYNEHPLDSNFSEPRVKFLNESDENPEKSFFLSLFLEMRNDLVLYSEYLQKIWSQNPPPPKPGERDTESIEYMNSCRFCAICGVRFGSKRYSVKAKQFYRVKRQFDHSHFQKYASELRSVICAG